MSLPITLLLSLILFSAVLVSVLVALPGITASRGGKILAFLVLFVLPLLCMAIGVASEV